ncbi:acyl-CoA carboxylase subunit epsilon [Nocardioides aequoreus]|uniref:acyl-CoA carboxylase subunit epsilon n=1 Tax=Nocardioides aequoreus TaxID=397278 RepID=UPI0009FD02FB|nr:acyl-CoA carboxylase subunit epsilon [Nocardioides aequoreus]
MSEPDETTPPAETVETASPVEPVETTPLLRVVKGDPTPEQLAALVAVVAASAGGGGADAPRRRSEWAAPQRRVRQPHLLAHRHGPGAWRASAR